MTDIDAYGSFGGDVGLNIQVGKYIRFRSLFGMTVDEPHFITNASAGVDTNHDGRVDLDTIPTRRTRSTASRLTSPAAASASRRARTGACWSKAR